MPAQHARGAARGSRGCRQRERTCCRVWLEASWPFPNWEEVEGVGVGVFGAADELAGGFVEVGGADEVGRGLVVAGGVGRM